MKHDLDIVLVEGIGTCTRKQARDETVRRSTMTGQMVTEERLPVGWLELTVAYHVAAQGDAWKPYIQPENMWPTSFFD